MKITPLILGNGRAGHAIANSLNQLGLLYPQFQIQTPVALERNANLQLERKKYEAPLLCIANPHGLHAQAILDAAESNFPAVICEKPACVNLKEIESLRKIKMPVAVLHGYRQTWGVQTLKQMIEDGELGALVTVEGRYWQASSAEWVRAGSLETESWKNKIELAGEFDTFLDIATHWVDAVSFLYGSLPFKIQGWKSNLNAETSHRDTHVQLALSYRDSGRGFGSISKTVHGATNHFEINLIGTEKSATWKFLNPDEIELGEGRDRCVITRKSCDFGSKQSPFHAQGWLEGYLEIAHGLLSEVFEGKVAAYPKLHENLDLLEIMLKTEWEKN